MISASTCESGVCSDWFDIASSPCAQSTNVMVTAFATNLLGDGPPSQPTEIVLLSENGTPIMAIFRIFFRRGEGRNGFPVYQGEAKTHIKSHIKSLGHSLNMYNVYVHVHACINYSQVLVLIMHTFAEVTGCPVYDSGGCPVCDKKLDLRFIVFSTISSAANILLLASISVIIAIVVRWRKSLGDDANSGNEGTEATAVYDEINLPSPLSADIDTKENVAYRQIILK